jgi:hypothetical protein
MVSDNQQVTKVKMDFAKMSVRLVDILTVGFFISLTFFLISTFRAKINFRLYVGRITLLHTLQCFLTYLLI